MAEDRNPAKEVTDNLREVSAAVNAIVSSLAPHAKVISNVLLALDRAEVCIDDFVVYVLAGIIVSKGIEESADKYIQRLAAVIGYQAVLLDEMRKQGVEVPKGKFFFVIPKIEEPPPVLQSVLVN